MAGHESFVKGVAWDPVGTYLASQGDDKSVHVWRVEDWTRVAVIREPFLRTQGSATFSLRLCWSPDGRTLTAPNSTNNGQCTAAVLDRETWKARRRRGACRSTAALTRGRRQCSNYVVGHKQPIVTVRFNGRLFHPLAAVRRPKGAAQPLCCVVAVGSQDCMARAPTRGQPGRVRVRARAA